MIVAGPGNDRIHGRGGSDVICGGAGRDRIYGGKGIDRVYGGRGNDRIYGQMGTDHLFGGAGRDHIFGGRGTDFIEGGGGRDTLLGGAGNDRMRGGPGDHDFLLGGSGDDKLNGGAGKFDRVYGGLGADRVSGGAGNYDHVRGDSGHDLMDGGGGRHDVASFATATPPGAAAFGINGVYVNLPRGIAYGAGFGVGKTTGIDRLRRIDDIIGSPFDDKIVTGPHSRVEGGFGDDIVNGVRQTRRVPQGRFVAGGQAGASATQRSYVGFPNALDRHSSLHVIGSPGDDRISIGRSGRTFVVTVPTGLITDRAGSLPAGTGCQIDPSGTVASCVSAGGVDTLAVNAGDGNDEVQVEKSAPRTLASYLNGGNGNNSVSGGPGDDFIQSGRHGSDVLHGGGGDDSLQGFRSDTLLGGHGDDLLVVAFPCGGEVLRGGPGNDRANFAPARSAVRARLGGPITISADCVAGRIGRDVENLEGTRYGDVLIGDNGKNSLMGRKGDDLLKGRGGSDSFDGGGGTDRCMGGGGRDSAVSCEFRSRIP